MKTLYLLLFLPILSFAQDTHNFKIENGKLVYEKIIQESKSLTDIKSAISTIPGTFVMESPEKIVYKIENAFVPIKAYGADTMATMPFAINPFSGTLTVEIKEDKFRIRAENLTYQDRALSMVMGSGELQVEFEAGALRKKNSEFRTGKSNLRSLSYYDRFFTELFQNQSSGDW